MAQQTLNAPSHEMMPLNTRPEATERGDTAKDLVTKIQAMFTELYAVITATGAAIVVSTITGVGSNPIIERSAKLFNQGAQAAKTTSTTLTAAEIFGGLITGNQGAAGAATYTLPLAADVDTLLTAAAANDAFDFSVINISTVAAEDITIATNTGWTLVGNMVITESAAASGANSVGRFRARKTGAGAWTLYRIA